MHFVKRLIDIEISLEDVDKGIEEKKSCLTINNHETTGGYIFLGDYFQIFVKTFLIRKIQQFL